MAAEDASKITPDEFDALLKFGVTLLKVFYVFRHVFECFSLYFTNAHGRNPRRALTSNAPVIPMRSVFQRARDPSSCDDFT